jgi:Outer membrane protein beta-barrel domain
MIYRVFVLLITVCCGFSSFAQKNANKVPRPDLPGSFMIDFGFNQLVSKPDNYSQKFVGSHTFNLYYQYPIRLGRSHYSFNPGVGFSFERFTMKNNYTLIESTTAKGTYGLANTAPLFPNASGIKKSQLINNYVEIPLDFRFDTKPEDLAHSFNLSFGGRVGYLIDAMTKIKYRQDGENRVMKNKQNHGMNPFRYGVYTRIGIGVFNVFGFYNLTPLFEADKGPVKGADRTTTNTYTVGISINGF